MTKIWDKDDSTGDEDCAQCLLPKVLELITDEINHIRGTLRYRGTQQKNSKVPD